jgi:hypothetical protein
MMGRVVLVAVVGIIILSYSRVNAVKPLCFFINKEHTKRICFASEEDVNALSNGKVVHVVLSEANERMKTDEAMGIIVEQDKVIITSDYPITRELSGLDQSIKILRGEYPLNIEGDCVVAVVEFD